MDCRDADSGGSWSFSRDLHLLDSPVFRLQETAHIPDSHLTLKSLNGAAPISPVALGLTSTSVMMRGFCFKDGWLIDPVQKWPLILKDVADRL